MPDIFNQTVANAPAPGTALADQVRQNKGYAWYVQRNAVKLGDELVQEMEFASEPTEERKTVLDPRGLAPRELLNRVTALNMSLNVKTLGSDSFLNALYSGTENQWTAAVGGGEVTITDMQAAATRPSFGAVAVVESYDAIESAIYFAPYARIKGNARVELDGLPGKEFIITPVASATAWTPPASLKSATSTADDGPLILIRVDCLTSQVGAVLDILWASIV
ncbi:hypothetical protein [Deinococcus marmoris]|uniref:Uncharacterized protein n=1 Tax=Deinococcus marmoris TaxID=249408 RepID=A0A1U7P2Z5_9DEIO|nr:hypothetical protein [Deinococcus marmoris]OLV19534.1 hypothetical protein BOO71_0002341 [Deinococcus marmoris]